MTKKPYNRPQWTVLMNFRCSQGILRVMRNLSFAIVVVVTDEIIIIFYDLVIDENVVSYSNVYKNRSFAFNHFKMDRE